ncbi:Short-chain dehydrogenase TIC 32-like protein [Lachnellula hyalina]|uniref:Short-chain dehydrogenase TIC 32-like protein n=1 Tax=Lachnellula hyalina TaxID=1316788 RepID=A0A8H8R034_9HELO|nr:Short-chain dehydrogenase TIC 32-like protein [Lachnellula hyalina]TVY25883.1 Short-chain dehydrogenase TIC 32-like protein [Lachnellula hyalina]
MPSFNRSTTGKEVVAAFPSSIAGKTFIAAIRAIDPSIRTTLVLVDLASQSSVRSAAQKINDDVSIGQIDAVINCAGIMARPSFEVTEGIEAQFGSNHIGHFLLTNLVLGKVVKAGQEGGGNGEDLRDLSWGRLSLRIGISSAREREGKEYHAWLAYAQSKTANVLFTAALAEKLKNKGVQSFALQPGQNLLTIHIVIMETNLGKHATPESWQSVLTIANETSGGKEIKMEEPKTLQRASTALVAALDPSIAEFSGGFLQDCVLRPVEQAYAKGKENADKLWVLSEKLVGEKFDL